MLNEIDSKTQQINFLLHELHFGMFAQTKISSFLRGKKLREEIAFLRGEKTGGASWFNLVLDGTKIGKQKKQIELKMCA